MTVENPTPTTAVEGVIMRLVRPYLQKYAAYLIAAIAGLAGYGGGSQGVVEKCLGGITAKQAQTTNSTGLVIVPAEISEDGWTLVRK